MQLSKRFSVARTRDEVVETLAREDVLVSLLPGKTEIVSREGDTVTTCTRYTVLGREGDATFHWRFRMDGTIAFEKVCDGRVWKELSGRVTLQERGPKLRVRIEMEGKTKGFVPEFTIKGPLEDQLSDMVDAVRAALGS